MIPNIADKAYILDRIVISSLGCWEWTKALEPSGYGRVSVMCKRSLAHRISYVLWVGEIPDGLVLDHLCSNRKCVNPFHLEPVTNKENLLRGEGACARNARKTHCRKVILTIQITFIELKTN